MMSSIEDDTYMPKFDNTENFENEIKQSNGFGMLRSQLVDLSEYI